MTQDLVSMQITQEQEDQVMALFAQLEALLPELINLPPDRRGLSMMGPRSDRYVRGSLDLANQNAGMIPRDVDLTGANADLQARDRMLRITHRAKQFAEKCDDTTAALGSDLMFVANLCYAMLKALGKTSGLDDAVKELGYRFARRKKKPAAAEEQ